MKNIEKVKLVYKGPSSVQIVDDPEIAGIMGVDKLVFKRGEPTECPKYFAEEKISRSPQWWELEKGSTAKIEKPKGGEK